MRVSSNLHTRSPRPYKSLGELDYPLHDWTATMTHCGRICYNRRKINLSLVFAGQNVGVKLGRPQRRPECCARTGPCRAARPDSLRTDGAPQGPHVASRWALVDAEVKRRRDG